MVGLLFLFCWLLVCIISVVSCRLLWLLISWCVAVLVSWLSRVGCHKVGVTLLLVSMFFFSILLQLVSILKRRSAPRVGRSLHDDLEHRRGCLQQQASRLGQDLTEETPAVVAT